MAIVDYAAMCERIHSYTYCETIENGKDCETIENGKENEIESLDQAIDDAVTQACVSSLDVLDRVHLAFSGGVDSSLILAKIIAGGFPVTAHTMALTAHHPDLVHAEAFVNQAKIEGADIQHVVHILTPTIQDKQESNRLLGNDGELDNYYLLMKSIVLHASHIICCDLIDELLGGYHMHRDPAKFFPHYCVEKDLHQNRLDAFYFYLGRLIPNHLDILELFSNYFNLTVWCPYGNEAVMNAASKFTVLEMVDDESRKKPVYHLAAKMKVLPSILERRKYGLVSAFHDV